MNRPSFHIVRVGTAITFVWIGILILQDPVGWSGYILPWMLNFIPVPAATFMLSIAAFDILVGYLLLINKFTWYASAAAVVHLLTVLIASGINAITVRDIGLLAASLAIFFDSKKPRHFW